MAAYAYAGVCYQDVTGALLAFQNSFPFFDSSRYTSLVSASLNTSGLITFSAKGVLTTGAAWGPTSYTLQLFPCFSPDMSQWPVQSFLFIFALFFAGVFGFRTGYRP